LEAFAQFGSDLDEKTRKQIERGKRTVEVLKQAQYEPIPVENQVAVLYALTQGYIDDIKTEKVSDWERNFHKYMKSTHKETLDLIKKEQDLSDKIIKKLKKAIEGFKEIYTE